MDASHLLYEDSNNERSLNTSFYEDYKTDVKIIQTVDTECPSIKNHTAKLYKDKIYVFGGYNGFKNLNKLLVLDLHTHQWEHIKYDNLVKDIPEGRNGHTSLVILNKMYVIGGWIGQVQQILNKFSFFFNPTFFLKGQHASSELYILDLDTFKWTHMQTHGQEPGPCNMHTAEYYQNKIYIYRGGDGKSYLSDLHSLSVNTLTWEKVQPQGNAPPPRANHGSSIIENNMYIFGGWDGKKRLNDLYRLNLKTLLWIEIDQKQVIDMPPARAGMKMINVNSSLYMFGGSGPSQTCYNDLWMYEPMQNQWFECRLSLPDNEESTFLEGNDQSGDSVNKETNVLDVTLKNTHKETMKNSLNPRSGHSMCLYKNHMYIVGGSYGANYHKNYVIFDVDPQPEISLKNEELHNQHSFLDNIKSFYNNESFADVEFNVAGEIIFGHKIILSLAGEALNKMFTSGMKESKKVIDIHMIHPTIFKIIIKSIYENALHLTHEETNNLPLLFELYKTYDEFLIHKMILPMQAKIKDLIHPHNIHTILHFALQVKATFLIKYCLWIQRNQPSQHI